MPRVIGGRYGLVVQGLHAGHGEGGVRRARRSPTPRTASRSASTTTSRTPASTSIRSFSIEPARRRARGVLRARRRRHGRRQQEQREDHRRGCRAATRRATSSTTRTSPARRPSRICASAREPIHAPYLIAVGELRRLPPVRFLDAAGRAAARRTRRDVPAQQPVRGRRGLGPTCRARCSSRSSTSGCASTSSTPRRSRARSASAAASTPSCRPASSPSPACCRARRRSQHIKHSIEKTYGAQGRGGGAPELRGRRRHAGPPVRGAVPATATSTFDRPPIVPDSRARVRARASPPR